MRSSVTLLALLCGLAAAGCADPRLPSPTPPQAVDEVHAISVLSPPMASDWDGTPGADGLMVSVHLWRVESNLPVTVRGKLEFTMYEGIIRPGDLAKAKPFQQWVFTGPQLSRHVGRSIAGWGYAFRLPWSRPPATTAVTLTTRYVPVDGTPVQAAPAIISIREI